jgi:hypothetical protein
MKYVRKNLFAGNRKFRNMFRASLKLRDGEYTDVRIYFFRVNFDMEAVCVHVHRRQSGI